MDYIGIGARMEATIYKPGAYKSNAYKRYSVYKGAGVYKLPYGSPQEWTKQNVPAGLQTLHDFGDGAGPVPAIPFDAAAVTNDAIKIIPISSFGSDSASVTNEAIEITEVI